KRLDALIDTVREIWRVRPEVRLEIVGNAPDEERSYFEELKSRVRSEGLGENVVFSGFIGDSQILKAKYRASRFCINVSAFEGFPKTVYESMAFGAVPILSRLDSYEGFLTEGENVFYADEPIAE